MNLILLLAAVAPAVFLLVKVYRMDKIEKEPGNLLLKLLLFGALSVIPAAIGELLLEGLLSRVLEESSLLYNLVSSFLIVALLEEGCKYLFLRAGSFKSPAFNYRFDGVVYAVFVSLGFALVENVLYVFQYGLSVALSRALLSVPLHAVCGVYMGLAYGRVKADSQYAIVPKGQAALRCVLLPLLIHGFYDFCLFMGTGLTIALFVVFVIAIFILCLKRLKRESRQDSPI